MTKKEIWAKYIIQNPRLQKRCPRLFAYAKTIEEEPSEPKDIDQRCWPKARIRNSKGRY